jgi:hypothetical protein
MDTKKYKVVSYSEVKSELYVQLLLMALVLCSSFLFIGIFALLSWL